jgi:hypothetical protein
MLTISLNGLVGFDAVRRGMVGTDGTWYGIVATDGARYSVVVTDGVQYGVMASDGVWYGVVAIDGLWCCGVLIARGCSSGGGDKPGCRFLIRAGWAKGVDILGGTDIGCWVSVGGVSPSGYCDGLLDSSRTFPWRDFLCFQGTFSSSIFFTLPIVFFEAPFLLAGFFPILECRSPLCASAVMLID